MEKDMATVSFNLMMVKYTLVNGIKIRCPGKEHIVSLMVAHIKANGKMTNKMGMGFRNFHKAIDSKANG